ncbi:XRE family transcriptional regulator [Acidithiobacillus caldus]|uniref:XRE family transcriptional regulator n=1 Tax=Acidithiobacillus caldus TaxID=33059 RepID=UPI001300FB93|nr:XRE family transcriptional regulator [Acidithiobacillus caldus]
MRKAISRFKESSQRLPERAMVTKNNFKKDLLYDDEDQSLARVRLDLIDVIRSIIKENGWTQSYAATKMDMSRSKLCKLIGGKLWYTSELRLIKSIIYSGYNVEIKIEKKSGPGKGEVTVIKPIETKKPNPEKSSDDERI